MPFERDFKRRKLAHTPEGSPERSFLNKREGVFTGNDRKTRGNLQSLQSSPCERVGRSSFLEEVDEAGRVEIYEDSEEDEERSSPPEPVKRILPLSDRGLSGRLLQLSLGGSIQQYHEYPVNGK